MLDPTNTMTPSRLLTELLAGDFVKTARELMDHHGIKGDLAQVRNNSFRIVRPGTVYEVTYPLGTGTAKIRPTWRI